ncbi:hypothetical protein HS7_19370 [Sulfolobales archaeon HS-7]|nr:hypothetical protein HS7_19370 [Sulfolobales archaeon HS-7]
MIEDSFIFIVLITFTLITPLYFRLLYGKLSNVKAFAFAWTTAFYYISYIFNYGVIPAFIALVLLNVSSYFLIIKEHITLISTGIIFLLTICVLVIIYYVLL